VEVPADFKAALQKSGTTRLFEALSPSKKKNMVLLINEAKTQETRLKRIEKFITSLE